MRMVISFVLFLLITVNCFALTEVKVVSVYANEWSKISFNHPDGTCSVGLNGVLSDVKVFGRTWVKVITPRGSKYEFVLHPGEFDCNHKLYQVYFCPDNFHTPYHTSRSFGGEIKFSKPRNCCSCCFGHKCSSNRYCKRWYKTKFRRNRPRSTYHKIMYHKRGFNLGVKYYR